MTGLLALLLAALASACVIGGLLRSGAARVALDHANERSLHTGAIPRIGGLGIAAGALGALAWAGLPVLAVIGAALSALSFLDDRRGLPVLVRFAAHFAAAFALLVATPLPPVLWWLVVPLLVWMTNLYNFMDGADGLAGGMAVAGFGAYAAAAWLGGQDALCIAALGVVGAALGFLAFNFPPARVFMGDAGSILLGFLAGAFGLLGWLRGAWPLWFPFVVFAPFVADATVTLLRRAARGERVWQAHRSHYYQRLVRLGWGHRRTALAAYVLMAVLAVLGVAGSRAGPVAQGVVIVAAGAILVAIGARIDRAWGRHAAGAGTDR